MRHERSARRVLNDARHLAVLAAVTAGCAVQAAEPTKVIFTCIDAQGRRLTSDRPIPECVAREQRVLNPDGSLREVRPPTPTAEEVSAREARERAAAEERKARAEAVRRDRNLISRFPDEASHQRAREAALGHVRDAMRASEKRLKDLATERKPLLDEAEFYKGRALPPLLKSQLDANQVAADAQRASMVNQQAEMARVNRLYDAELARLRQLWAGAPPGSVPPTGNHQAPASAPASGAR